MAADPKDGSGSPMRRALAAGRIALLPVAAFSLGINLLMLTLPLYMMQVFDRVLGSGSRDTLIYLTAIALAALLTQVMLDFARSQVMLRTGIWLDRVLAPDTFARSLDDALAQRDYGSQALRDLAALRNFLAGQGVFSLFDALWAPVYLLVVFLLHPLLGIIALAGALLLLGLAALAEAATRKPAHYAGSRSIAVLRRAEMAGRNAEVIAAMGMLSSLRRRWQDDNNQVLDFTQQAATRSGGLVAATKFIRMAIQIVLMAVGAVLVLDHAMTGGAMIAGSIIMGRALAPVEQAIGTWRQVLGYREARSRLDKFFSSPAAPPRGAMTLPAPKGRLVAEAAVFRPPGAAAPVLKGVGFAVDPGEALGVVGPSAAGKSTLARLLVGVWRPDSGCIRLDGADVYDWPRDDFGRHVGYVPQDVELFAGTVRDNIARLGDAADEAVTKAAMLAGVHDMVLRLPKGYDTEIGEGGLRLSGGQRQRLALARALFGAPRLVVLDEPNASLDGEGEMALARTVAQLKGQGVTLVVISHRQRLLLQMDKLLLLRGGMVEAFGPRDQILTRLMPTPTQAAPASAAAMPQERAAP